MTKRRTTPLLELDAYDFPRMPWWIHEQQALAGVLGNELYGAMTRLRMHAWRQKPRCTLPDDDRTLARISGLGAAWSELGATLREYFTVTTGGRLRDPQLTQWFIDAAIQYDISQSRRFAGKTGGTRSAESRQASGKQPAEQPGSNGRVLPDPRMSYELQEREYEQDPGSEGEVDTSQPGQATGEATGQATGAAPEWRDWRRLIDPVRAAAHDREVATANPAPTSPTDAGASDVPPSPQAPSAEHHHDAAPVSDASSG